MRPFFLPATSGERLCILHEPPEGIAARGSIIYIHPFAEEMNRSRRMVALQSRVLATAGWTVLQIDLLGCGDSAGDFGDATWEQWVADVRTASQWLEEKVGRKPILWGLRAGCLLCVQAAAEALAAPTLIFWQPVVSGRQHLDQFLRVAAASDIVSEGARASGRVQRLREQIVAGETVEIAGYGLSPALAAGLGRAELTPAGANGRLAWLEVRGSDEKDLRPDSQSCLEQWQRAGFWVETRVVRGPPFWQVSEVADCLQLVDATVEALQELHEHL